MERWEHYVGSTQGAKRILPSSALRVRRDCSHHRGACLCLVGPPHVAEANTDHLEGQIQVLDKELSRVSASTVGTNCDVAAIVFSTTWSGANPKHFFHSILSIPIRGHRRECSLAIGSYGTEPSVKTIFGSSCSSASVIG